MRNWGALAAALVGAVILAIIGTTPPAPAGVDAPAPAFSADRAMVDVRAIGAAPHPTGSAEIERVRGRLTGRLADMGMSVQLSRSPLSARGVDRLEAWSGEAVSNPEAVNIIATLPGENRELPAVLLMAHYDSVWGSPGAADDGAGVAAILEIVRAVAAGPAPRRDLMVLLTDAEELSLDGSEAFFDRNPLRARVGGIVNLEARGGGGRATLFETSAENGAAVRLFADAASHPAGSSLSAYVYKKLPNDTDLSSALGGAYTAYNFAFIGRAGLYHSPLATPDALGRGALQDMGAQALGLTKALLAAEGLPQPAPDIVFFDAFGLVFLSYAPALGWLMLAAAAALYAAPAWRRAGGKGVLRGALALIGLAALSAGLLYAANLVSGADGPVNYYDRLAAIPRLELQALLIALAAFLIVPAPRPMTGGNAAGAGLGAALPLLVLGLAAQAAAPTAAYPLAVPLLLGGIGAAARRWPGGTASAAAAAIAAMLVTGYMLQFGHQIMQSVGADLPMAAALPLCISAVLVWPIMPRIGRKSAHMLAGILLLGALATALTVRLDPVAASAAVYSLED